MTAHFLRVSAGELDTYLADSAQLAARIHATDEDGRRYDIDKSWDGIIYLLTGQNSSSGHPLARLIFSGQLIDKDQNLGTGPAHYLDAGQVQALYEALKDIDPAVLKTRFDAAAMTAAGVYPGNAWQEEGTDDYLVEYFELVQEILATAAGNREALITFLQ